MKKYFKQTLVCAFIVLIAISCSKSSSSVTPTTAIVADTAFDKIITSGTWQLTAFAQPTEDKGNSLIGSMFTFFLDGTMKVSDGKQETQGTWNYTAAVTYYGSSSTSAMVLNLGAVAPVSLLTKKMESWFYNFVSVQTRRS